MKKPKQKSSSRKQAEKLLKFCKESLLTFMKRPFYHTVNGGFEVICLMEAIWEYLFDKARGILNWLQGDMKHYFARILYALVDKALLPPYAYWSTKDYINDVLLQVLPWYIEEHNSYPSEYKNVEAYIKDLKEFLVLCQQFENDDEDLMTADYWGSRNPKDSIHKAAVKERTRRYVRRQHFYANILPYLWD